MIASPGKSVRTISVPIVRAIRTARGEKFAAKIKSAAGVVGIIPSATITGFATKRTTSAKNASTTPNAVEAKSVSEINANLAAKMPNAERADSVLTEFALKETVAPMPTAGARSAKITSVQLASVLASAVRAKSASNLPGSAFPETA